MSLKKSKLDLLVRVRYSNPLPAPPCPPKLFDIPTDPKRYARPELLNSLANQAPLPMIVDAECGMPLDLSRWECLWDDTADDSELNPDPDNLPKLDPKDEFLAYDVSGSSANTNTPGTPGQNVPLANVPWLRKTEYTSKSDGRASINEMKSIPAAMIVDVSPAAQIRDIEATFTAANEDFSLENLRHPTKPKIVAVDSYEFLPDLDTWPNTYDLFRFAERPGERNVDQEDHRLDCAILRPMKAHEESFLAYYLTADDASALEYKRSRAGVPPYEVPVDQPRAPFRFVRDYEPVNIEMDLEREYLFILDDGAPSDDADDVFGTDDVKSKHKGAFYKNIERKMTLKKKRANVFEQYVDKWDLIHVQHVEMTREEEEERDLALESVADPLYSVRLMADAEAEAEPEVDMDDMAMEA